VYRLFRIFFCVLGVCTRPLQPAVAQKLWRGASQRKVEFQRSGGTRRHLGGIWAPTGRTGNGFRPGWFAQMPAYAALCLLVPAFFRKFYRGVLAHGHHGEGVCTRPPQGKEYQQARLRWELRRGALERKRNVRCLRTATMARRRSEAMAWRFAGANEFSASPPSLRSYGVALCRSKRIFSKPAVARKLWRGALQEQTNFQQSGSGKSLMWIK
jgi:hypothetical protein